MSGVLAYELHQQCPKTTRHAAVHKEVFAQLAETRAPRQGPEALPGMDDILFL